MRQRPGGRFYLDARWPAARLTVEIDGAGHRDPATWSTDLRRQNQLVLDGDRVLRFSSATVRNDPDTVVTEIRAAPDGS